MRRIIGLCAGLALMAFPALADAPFAPPTPLLDADQAKPGPKAVAHGFTLNGVHGVLTQTNFAEVQKRFGGQLARQGQGGESLAWLCYDLPAKHLRVWLMAGELYIGDGKISGVTIWTVPSPANSPLCPVPTGEQSAAIDSISPGESWAKTEARLGTPGLEKSGWAAYAHAAKVAGFDDDDSLTLKTDNGVITDLQAWRTVTN